MSALPNAPPLADALAWTVGVLQNAGVPDAQTDAEWLLVGLLGIRRSELPLHARRPLTATQHQRLQATVAQRRRRVPLQQILGQTEFYSLPFNITPHVLIPRPETERLVDALAARLRRRPRAMRCYAMRRHP